jgi:hypothetical protein
MEHRHGILQFRANHFPRSTTVGAHRYESAKKYAEIASTPNAFEEKS